MWKVIAAVVIALTIVLGYRWWTGDERAIKRQLTAIGESLTVDPNEGSLGPVTRIAMLRKTLAPDIRVAAGPHQPASGADASDRMQQIVGRDAVLGAASRWAPPGGVTVDFVNVRVTVGEGRTDAQVACTGTITSRGGSAAPTVDARDLTIGFTKVEGTWLVSSVQVLEFASQ